jgi:hypothetical protein
MEGHLEGPEREGASSGGVHRACAEVTPQATEEVVTELQWNV